MKQAITCLLFVLLSIPATAQDLREKAAQAWERAQAEEAMFRTLPAESRTRNEHLRIIHLYERVYLTTPHSGYSDDALINIATLYEETGAYNDAVRTLRFLVSDYPSSRHIPEAQNRIARLTGPTGAPGVESALNDTPERVAAPGEALVDGIRYWESTDSLRVVVDMQGEPVFTRGEAYDPPRVYLDIANAEVSPELSQREFPVGSGMLHGIRVGQHDTDTVRVVLDLEELSNVATITLADPSRIVIDILGTGTIPPGATASATRPIPAPPADAATPVAVSTTVAADAAPLSSPALPTEDGDYTLSRSLGLKPRRVVIDPGHGGHDPGTIGPSGLSEAELVLDIAKRVRARIEADIPNAEVILTREDDTFIPLEQRPSTANQAGADLFISIHANSSRTRSIRGVETYFLNLNPSQEALEIAARENATSERATSEAFSIVSEIMTQEWLDESREFAGHIQKALASRDEFGRDRGVKQAPLVVLLGANMPSILAEISFISNPDDERLLKGDARRQEIADALFEGVRSYFSTLSGIHTAELRAD